MTFSLTKSLLGSTKRWSSLIGLVAVLAVGAGTAAASAASASIHLKAPSSVAVGKHFTVTASGTSPTRKEWVVVVFTTKHPCPANLDATRVRGWYQTIPFPGASNDGAVKVGMGNYSVTSKRLRAADKETGKLCGLLFSRSNAPPQAHVSKTIKFT